MLGTITLVIVSLGVGDDRKCWVLSQVVVSLGWGMTEFVWGDEELFFYMIQVIFECVLVVSPARFSVGDI